ncbi:sulfotransferase [bacterium]|nr:sulfotransferase [bacterium]
MNETSLKARAFSEIIRRGSRALRGTGRRYVQLDPALLLRDASARTGLRDFGEPGFRPPLERLLRSYDREAGLTLLGRIAARQDTVRLLANRLQLVAERQRHPELAAEPIRQPWFVTGLPRTGTTLLHGLLAQDPGHRAPLHWEMMYPVPPRGRARGRNDRRRELAERQIRWFHRLAPDFRRIHPIGASLPEECLIITSHSFLSFQFQTSHRVPSYQAWLEAQDLRPAYAQHRQILQQLQWRTPPRHWVLKAPAHLYGIEAIADVYPDAAVIMTHRDPLQVAASVASLHFTLRSTFSDVADPHEIGAEVCARWAEGMTRALAARDRGVLPAARVVDVSYDALVRDPLAAVRQVYARLDRALTPSAEERMRRFLAAHPKDRFGRHRYTLAQFGLEPARVRSAFAAYCARFGL